MSCVIPTRDDIRRAADIYVPTDRNPNAFIDHSRATEKDFVVAAQTIYDNAKHPSTVELPIIPQSRARHWIETPFSHMADASARQ